MDKRLVIKTNDPAIGTICSKGALPKPQVWTLYDIGSKSFELVSVTDADGIYTVQCRPFIEATGEIQ